MADIKTYFKKPKGWRKDKKYMEAIKTLPCSVCKAFGVDAHHRIGNMKGMALRSPDYETMPLCRAHHLAVHDRPHDFDQVKFIINARKTLISKGLIKDQYEDPE